MPPRAWTVVDLGTEQYRIPAPGKEIKMQSSSSGMPGGRKGIVPHLYARQLSTPRSTAIFNSKACLLWETRNASCDSSEWEPPVGTAAFYTRLARQLSIFKKPLSFANLVESSVWAGAVFSLWLPWGPAQSWRDPIHGCQTGLHEPRGCFTSGHLSTSAT